MSNSMFRDRLLCTSFLLCNKFLGLLWGKGELSSESARNHSPANKCLITANPGVTQVQCRKQGHTYACCPGCNVSCPGKQTLEFWGNGSFISLWKSYLLEAGRCFTESCQWSQPQHGSVTPVASRTSHQTQIVGNYPFPKMLYCW